MPKTIQQIDATKLNSSLKFIFSELPFLLRDQPNNRYILQRPQRDSVRVKKKWHWKFSNSNQLRHNETIKKYEKKRQ